MKATLLITGCGGHFMLDTIQCYRNEDIRFRIIGVASKPDEYLRPYLDEYIEVPTSNTPGYVDLLLEICRDRKVDVLVPTIDEEIYPLYLRRNEFAEVGTLVSASEAGMYGSSKIAFLELLESAGIRHPAYRVVETPFGLERAARSLGYPENPVCIKLPDKAGSRGFRILREDAWDFHHFANEKPSSRCVPMKQMMGIMRTMRKPTPVIVQEYLPGDEYSVDLLAEHGKVKLITGRRNISLDNSIPTKSILEKNEDAFRISEEIVRAGKMDGNIGFDFIFDGNGEIVPIEVNARITATISLSAWGGCNLAYEQVARLLGRSVRHHDVKYGRGLSRRMRAIFIENIDKESE